MRGLSFKEVTFAVGVGDSFGTAETIADRDVALVGIVPLTATGSITLAHDAAAEVDYTVYTITTAGGIGRSFNPAGERGLSMPSGLKVFGTAATKWLLVYKVF